MKREDIVYESAGAHNPEDYVLSKSEAEAMFDAYEARIKELEKAEHFLLRKCKEYRDVIKELVAENERLKEENLKHRKDNITMSLKYNEVLNDLNDENARLKAQVPKWHIIADGDLPDECREYDRFIVCCEVIVDGQKKTYTTEGILYCGEQPYTFADNKGYTLNATHWCELIKPTTTEKEEKENG